MARDQFGVFILRAGRWALHATYPGASNARDEVAYLTGSLGLTAQLFQRVGE